MVAEICPSCGAPLLADAAGLCPACLLTRAIDANEPDDQVQGTGFAAGTRVGPFEIIRLLGKGGMATVYEAHEPALDRAVALKILPREFLHDGAFAQRFQQEAHVMAGLEHPNVVPIYAGGIDDGIPWLSMRLLPGGTVSAMLGGRVGIERALPVLRGIAEALDYAHGRGVIHRDMKPSNILLDETGHVCVADFGLARLMKQGHAITSTGIIVGTAQYMAPEQALGEPLDHRCDLYSLGVIAFEMLTGVRPFDGASPIAILTKHVNDAVPLPSRHDVPDATARVLLKALAKKPTDRWPTATAFVNALEASVQARTASPPWRTIAVGATIATASLLIWMTRSSVLPTFRGLFNPPAIGGARPTVSELVPFPGAVVQILPPATVDADASRSDSPSKREAKPAGPSVGTQAPTPVDSGDRDAERPINPGPPVAPPIETPPGTEGPVVPANRTNLIAVTSTPDDAPSNRGETVTKAEKVYRVEPTYPPLAIAAGFAGDVVLEVRVAADGRVLDAKVLRSPNRVLNEPARKAVLQYRYKPQLRNGRPEPSTVEETVSFRLKP